VSIKLVGPLSIHVEDKHATIRKIPRLAHHHRVDAKTIRVVEDLVKLLGDEVAYPRSLANPRVLDNR
jgi:hypothetical protein